MKALVRTGLHQGAVELREVPLPEYGDHDVMIKIRAMGVCGSDVKIYAGEYDTNTPIIIGHEFSGEVVAVGKEVEHYFIGDRVSSELNLQSCRWCVDCRQGNYHLCSNRRPPGILINGTYAEYVALPEFILHKLPDNLSFEEGALMEPAAVVAHALLERAPVTPEDFVVIMGPGPLGLLAIQLARYCGARKILVSGRNSDRCLRLPMAKELGADYIINVDEENLIDYVDEITEGRGADLVIDCAGNDQAIHNGISICKKHGKLCTLATPGENDVAIPWKKALFKDMDVIFSYSASTYSWNIVKSLMERGVINTKTLITRREELGAFRNVFETFNTETAVKTVLFHKK